ncbi:PhnD/SsuA/transferrin family substrate-binding protein [Hoeflea sp.]|uniref:phosphate/phosphite/phosphonate ABC transporter substrate-binding protein n=1 Tax=Hoeflea sp. TaxID=1940281 RepID=UPI0019B8963B|nr:PhnD/SsuA/transferrin family substrate-binding protein [Hoeflea sp.]MBC7281739.1 PhnD/SsuA/transferrin family substrate-binding protein [Hoeflea sp.]
MLGMKPAAAFYGMFRMLCWAGLGAGAIMASGARADYRETVPVLRIGMVEAHVAAVSPPKLEAVRSAFASALRIPVEIIRMGSYAALIDAHASGRVGYAIHSTRSFAATDAVCGCVRAFRSPVAADGSTGFRSVLVVRDSVTRQISDLRVAYSREESVSGWQLPQQAIQTGGLEAPHLVRAGSVRSVIELYRAGEVDGFFGWIPDRPGDAGSDVTALFGGWNLVEIEASDSLRMVWSSQRIPYGPHAVHRTLPDDLAEALGAFLDQMPISAPGLLDIFEPVHGGGYTVPDPEDYRHIRGLVEALPADDAAALPAQ